MQPIHVAENLVWFNEIKVQSKSRSKCHTYTKKLISANISKDIIYGIKFRGFTSPAFSCYQIITTIRLCETGM